ncbi:MAG: hypothetical protein HY899_03795 [Deltaproteobacteria bacterium]|nr:hypothetical protein [Deltaproteobacteria bacterium]
MALAIIGVPGPGAAAHSTGDFQVIIDDQSFIDMAVHLRHASEDLLTAAQRLSRLCDPKLPLGGDRSELVEALDSLVAMNREFVAVEHVIRAVWDANHVESEVTH